MMKQHYSGKIHAGLQPVVSSREQLEVLRGNEAANQVHTPQNLNINLQPVVNIQQTTSFPVTTTSQGAGSSLQPQYQSHLLKGCGAGSTAQPSDLEFVDLRVGTHQMHKQGPADQPRASKSKQRKFQKTQKIIHEKSSLQRTGSHKGLQQTAQRESELKSKQSKVQRVSSHRNTSSSKYKTHNNVICESHQTHVNQEQNIVKTSKNLIPLSVKGNQSKRDHQHEYMTTIQQSERQSGVENTIDPNVYPRTKPGTNQKLFETLERNKEQIISSRGQATQIKQPPKHSKKSIHSNLPMNPSASSQALKLAKNKEAKSGGHHSTQSFKQLPSGAKTKLATHARLPQQPQSSRSNQPSKGSLSGRHKTCASARGKADPKHKGLSRGASAKHRPASKQLEEQRVQLRPSELLQQELTHQQYQKGISQQQKPLQKVVVLNKYQPQAHAAAFNYQPQLTNLPQQLARNQSSSSPRKSSKKSKKRHAQSVSSSGTKKKSGVLQFNQQEGHSHFYSKDQEGEKSPDTNRLLDKNSCLQNPNGGIDKQNSHMKQIVTTNKQIDQILQNYQSLCTDLDTQTKQLLLQQNPAQPHPEQQTQQDYQRTPSLTQQQQLYQHQLLMQDNTSSDKLGYPILVKQMPPNYNFERKVSEGSFNSRKGSKEGEENDYVNNHEQYNNNPDQVLQHQQLLMSQRYNQHDQFKNPQIQNAESHLQHPYQQTYPQGKSNASQQHINYPGLYSDAVSSSAYGVTNQMAQPQQQNVFMKSSRENTIQNLSNIQYNHTLSDQRQQNMILSTQNSFQENLLQQQILLNQQQQANQQQVPQVTKQFKGSAEHFYNHQAGMVNGKRQPLVVSDDQICQYYGSNNSDEVMSAAAHLEVDKHSRPNGPSNHKTQISSSEKIKVEKDHFIETYQGLFNQESKRLNQVKLKQSSSKNLAKQHTHHDCEPSEKSMDVENSLFNKQDNIMLSNDEEEKCLLLTQQTNENLQQQVQTHKNSVNSYNTADFTKFSLDEFSGGNCSQKKGVVYDSTIENNFKKTIRSQNYDESKYIQDLEEALYLTLTIIVNTCKKQQENIESIDQINYSFLDQIDDLDTFDSLNDLLKFIKNDQQNMLVKCPKLLNILSNSRQLVSPSNRKERLLNRNTSVNVDEKSQQQQLQTHDKKVAENNYTKHLPKSSTLSGTRLKEDFPLQMAGGASSNSKHAKLRSNQIQYQPQKLLEASKNPKQQPSGGTKQNTKGAKLLSRNELSNSTSLNLQSLDIHSDERRYEFIDGKLAKGNLQGVQYIDGDQFYSNLNKDRSNKKADDHLNNHDAQLTLRNHQIFEDNNESNIFSNCTSPQSNQNHLLQQVQQIANLTSSNQNSSQKEKRISNNFSDKVELIQNQQQQIYQMQQKVMSSQLGEQQDVQDASFVTQNSNVALTQKERDQHMIGSNSKSKNRGSEASALQGAHQNSALQGQSSQAKNYLSQKYQNIQDQMQHVQLATPQQQPLGGQVIQTSRFNPSEPLGTTPRVQGAFVAERTSGQQAVPNRLKHLVDPCTDHLVPDTDLHAHSKVLSSPTEEDNRIMQYLQKVETFRQHVQEASGENTSHKKHPPSTVTHSTSPPRQLNLIRHSQPSQGGADNDQHMRSIENAVDQFLGGFQALKSDLTELKKAVLQGQTHAQSSKE